MDSLTLFGHLFKTPCEEICIFLDFFTEKRGSHREIYDFFRKSHETHCICKRFSIYCNKNCSGNMRILCPFAETTYTPLGDENVRCVLPVANMRHRNNLHPVRGRKPTLTACRIYLTQETTYAPSGDENSIIVLIYIVREGETTHTPSGDEKASMVDMSPNISQNNSRPVRGRKLNSSTNHF